MDTYTNVVAYRGHQNPVWDVQWSPLGTYFATGSRDKTARLWSTDRVSALRIYAGHLSDVDVSLFPFQSVIASDNVVSVLDSTLTPYILPLDPAIGHVAFGTFKRGPQCESSSVIKVQLLRSP